MSHLVNTTEKMAADLAAFQLMKATTATAEKPGGDILDEQYVKTLAANKKRFNKERRKLEATEKAGKEPSDKRQKVIDLKLKEQTYMRLWKFENFQAGRKALWAAFAEDEWATPPGGDIGTSPHWSFHGGTNIGCFQLKSVDRKDKEAVCYLSVTDASRDLPEDMEGAMECTDNEDEDDSLVSHTGSYDMHKRSYTCIHI
jgi:hypothetical protein